MILLVLAAPSLAQNDPADAMRVPDGPLHEQVLSIAGDGANPVMLQVTLYTPPGVGPFPLAVVNHGATEASNNNRGPRYRYTFSAYYFLSRGYAVALPMMRGFAGSGGSMVYHGCDLVADGIANAKDIRAVIDSLATRPEIDVSRLVVAGQSFGGWNTLAFGTLDHTNVRGLVDFSGGIRSSDCAMQDVSMIAAAGYFGAHTTVPSIWFYGDNDKLFPVATWRGMYERYTKAGGRAELVAYGKFMTDSHQLLSFPEGMAIWGPKVDSFLDRIGLPGTLLHPEYVPTPFPPPTHYAAIDDVAAVPYLDDRGRALYRQFLTERFPRVFIIAAAGGVASVHGGVDPFGRAMRACRGQPGCGPYAVDDEVVWVKPDAAAIALASAPRIVQKTIPAGSTTTLDFSFSVNPDCTVRAVPQLSMTQQPEHGVARVAPRVDYPRFPPASPFAACDTVKVAGMALDYTPARGFTGADSLVFEVVGANSQHRVYRVALTVQ